MSDEKRFVVKLCSDVDEGRYDSPYEYPNYTWIRVPYRYRREQPQLEVIIRPCKSKRERKLEMLRARLGSTYTSSTDAAYILDQLEAIDSEVEP